MANRIVLVTASYDNTIQSWDVSNPTFSQTFKHPGQVNSLVITSDKQYIVAAGNADITLYRSDASPANPVCKPVPPNIRHINL
jgi:WD40 repeat protein